jgi:hypothetical protein
MWQSCLQNSHVSAGILDKMVSIPSFSVNQQLTEGKIVPLTQCCAGWLLQDDDGTLKLKMSETIQNYNAIQTLNSNR